MKPWIKGALWGLLIGFVLSFTIFYLLIPLWGIGFFGCGFESNAAEISLCVRGAWTKLILYFIIAPTIFLSIIGGIIGFFKRK